MTSKFEEKVYRYWWLHDAAWYQNVAKRFGFEVANELNKECLCYMAQRTMQAYVKENRIDTSFANIEDLVECLMQGSRPMWPDGWCQADAQILGPNAFEVVLSKNFAIDWLRRAGTLEQYACPGLALREGWFAGLGIQHYDQELECMVKGHDVCRFRTHIEWPSKEESQHE